MRAGAVCGPVPMDSPLSGTGPSKPLSEDGTAYPSGAGVPACARGAAAADVGERVFSRLRNANMNKETDTYDAVPQAYKLSVLAPPSVVSRFRI